MTPEISSEELRKLPGYEIRAHVFMKRVEELAEQVNKDHSSDLEVYPRDAYRGNRNLSKAEIRRRKKISKEYGYDWLSPEEREEMEVEVNPTCSFFEPIEEFVRKTFDLAREQGGRANGTTKPPSDEEIEKLIGRAYINPPHNFVYVSNLSFTFDENLPGSI